jgi:hypothetical protein
MFLQHDWFQIFTLVYDDTKETYTKEEYSAALEQQTQKLTEDFSKRELALKEEITALGSRASLTEKERKDLNDRVELLGNEQKTRAEQHRIELDKLTKKHTKELEDTIKDRDAWQSRYSSSLIKSELISAATKYKAYRPEQIFNLLVSNTNLVQELDEKNQPTGNLVPKVKITLSGDKGPQTLELSPDEAIKTLSENEDYLNLFIDGTKGGRGGSNKGQQADMKTLTSDPAAYRAARKPGGALENLV